MIQYCLSLYAGDADQCWMVGERREDEKAAVAAGINFIAADVWRDKFTIA
jgi:phosphoglycolate phosphatase-like HAD superfamily hydrolase